MRKQLRRKRFSVCLMAVLVLAIVGVSGTLAWAQPPIPTTDLALWLSANNVNGDDTNPADGAEVTTWADISGNGNHFTQRTDPADGPTYSTTGGPLGNPTVVFDGIDDQLANYAMGLTSPQIFMVMKGTGGTGFPNRRPWGSWASLWPVLPSRRDDQGLRIKGSF